MACGKGAKVARVGVALVAAAAGVALAAGAPEVHVRGTIAAVHGDEVQVVDAEGTRVTLVLGEQTRVALASRSDASAIAKGGYIGTTAVPAGDGTLRALEVHVFPEAMRGAGEGHRPWDLRPESSMTNATVASAGTGGGSSESTMTNAGVAGVKQEGGERTLTLAYAGGRQTVRVPPNTPVVRLEPATRSALAPGQHVFAAGQRQPDGTVRPDRITVGKGDVVPPM